MQTREQIKNWKVVASAATVAALGVSGLAVASPGDRSETPPPIEVEGQRDSDGLALTTTTAPGFEIVGGPSFSPDDSLDTPLASADLNDSPTAADSPAVLDSVDSPPTTSSTTSTAAPTEDDSPDVAGSPAVVDSPDSDDSPAPVSSPESVDSPDTGDSTDSADSVDSLDS